MARLPGPAPLLAFRVGETHATAAPSVGVDRASLPEAGYVVFRLVVVDGKGRESEPVEIQVDLLDRDGSTPF